MKLNELKETLCGKQCVATEIATGIIFAASIILWTSMPGFVGRHREKAEPARTQHVQGCTGTARMNQFFQPL